MEQDQLIPWRCVLRDYLHISPTTGWRRERTDPEFAALKVESGPERFAARLSDVQRYIANRPQAGPEPELEARAQKAVVAAQEARAKRRAEGEAA